MARFLPLLGGLSGKLGGMVFANNFAGPYVRSYVKPVDPRSAAQVAVRGQFASAAGSYHALTDPQKGAWKAYATNIFGPKSGGINSTGINAYTAIRFSALMANLNKNTMTMTSPAATITQTNFTPLNLIPPTSTYGSDIRDSTGNAIAQSLDAVTLSAAGAFTITVGLNGGIALATAPVFQEANTGAPAGYALYLSNPKTQVNQFFANPDLQQIASSTALSISTGWTSGSSFILNGSIASARIATFKSWVAVGNAVALSLYSVSASGMSLIGQKRVIIT